MDPFSVDQKIDYYCRNKLNYKADLVGGLIPSSQLGGAAISPASYIIYKDGSTIKAVNGTTGVVDFSGSDAYTIINNTIGVMNEGELLFIRKGTYDLTSKLSITKNIRICGENIAGRGTSLYGTILKRAGDVVAIDLSSGTAPDNTLISNIGIDGVDKSGIGLALKDYHGILDKTMIFNCNYGLDMQDCWTSRCYDMRNQWNNYGARLHTSGCSGINFHSCHFSRNSVTGLLYETGNGSNMIGGACEWNGQYGAYISGGSAFSFVGVFFEYNPRWSVGGINNGAHIKIGDVNYPSMINVYGCQLGNLDTDVNITSASRILITHGNRIFVANTYFAQASGGRRTDITNSEGSTLKMLILNCDIYPGGSNLVITGTSGIDAINTAAWITKNDVLSSTFAIDSTGIKTVTIDHGLAITPAAQDCYLTVIENTDVDDWAFNLLKVESVGATNIVAKINVSTASATGGATAKLGLRVGNP